MKRIFIDAGYYIGKALDYYAPFMDESWTVYAFEPNVELPVNESFKRFPFKIKWVKKAVWTYDGEVDFRIGGRNDASHIDSLRDSVAEKITVPCIDFSAFVKKLPQDSVIVCSMDIEGAEFPVLRKMIEDKTAQRISVLDIEFHHRLLLGEDSSSVSMLRRELEGNGTLVKLKLELS